MDLRGKIAIVTGGGGPGSGRAIAGRFAADGATVVVADINEQAARETTAALVAMDLHAAHFAADIGNEDSVRQLVAFALERFGGVDFVVNNASALVFPETSFDDSLANLRVDLYGAVLVTRHAIDALRRWGGGEHQLDLSVGAWRSARRWPRVLRLQHGQGRDTAFDHHTGRLGCPGEHSRQLPGPALDRHGSHSRRDRADDPRGAPPVGSARGLDFACRDRRCGLAAGDR